MAITRPPVLWTAAEAAAATDGLAAGEWAATGVSIDSRTVKPGDLFVALVGPNHDAHRFVADALAAGAAAAMVHRTADIVPAGAPLLVVDDTTRALQALAAFARLRTRAKIVAITGSVGKTGTKEALAFALAGQGATHATAGNLNNEFGVPLSLARLPAGAAYGVFEAGMNHAGELERLSRLLKPDAAIITTVAAAHLENFPSESAIADAKAEILRGMDNRGTAILNRDNKYFPTLVAHARTQGLNSIWSFGSTAEADARLIDCRLASESSAVRAAVRGRLFDYRLSVPGRHAVMNSLAVLLAVEAVGAEVGAAAARLSQLVPVSGRGDRFPIRLSPVPEDPAVTVIDESYNANPASMEAAIAVLAGTAVGPGGRRIAVLGDMLELGPQGRAMHAALADPLETAGIDLVFLSGPLMHALYEALPATRRAGYAPAAAELAEQLLPVLRPGDAVMVKGSLGSRMATVVTALRERGARTSGDAEPPAQARHSAQGG
ncbi:MAG: UDP-N-acetylmuramoylalanyl-D-glutamyl-2,6-diaminopimelate--D-alanyl-D-alanine ligase [Alphaproteobacteria bacterium]|nr:UDP-N-acetylmuramoylalanyl-D-glutamyl-2,6-diaminopimelate--D-alanyl-D-alanine ligase [Alphaproteobacteria bacterium]